MRPRLLMNFTLRCVRFYPGVNSRAELVTLAPGLRRGLYASWLEDYMLVLEIHACSNPSPLFPNIVST